MVGPVIARKRSFLPAGASRYGLRCNRKLCPAERARQLLEAIIKPGDRMGDRGRQSAAGRFSRPRPGECGGADVEFFFPLQAEATDRPELLAQYVVYIRR
jgi:hypothetical protein